MGAYNWHKTTCNSKDDDISKLSTMSWVSLVATPYVFWQIMPWVMSLVNCIYNLKTLVTQEENIRNYFLTTWGSYLLKITTIFAHNRNCFSWKKTQNTIFLLTLYCVLQFDATISFDASKFHQFVSYWFHLFFGVKLLLLCLSISHHLKVLLNLKEAFPNLLNFTWSWWIWSSN